MTDKLTQELKVLLKPIHQSENDVLLSYVTDLVHALGQSSAGQTPALQQLIQSAPGVIKQAMETRGSVQSYFSGRGLIATELRKQAAVLRYLGDTTDLLGRIQDKLRAFNYSPIAYGVTAEPFEFQQTLIEFLERVLNPETNAAPKLELKVGKDVTFETPTGYYGVRRKPGTEVVRVVVINTDILSAINDEDTPKPKLYVYASSDSMPQCFFWHPQEDTWVRGDFQCIIPNTLVSLNSELRHLEQKMEVSEEIFQDNASGLHELREIEHKVQCIFSNQELLPAVFGCYSREENASCIGFRSGQYGLGFYHTRAPYEQDTTSVYQYIGLYPQSIDFLKIPEENRSALLAVAHSVVDHLQNHIDKVMAGLADNAMAQKP